MKNALLFQRANRLLVRVLALVMFFSCEQLAQAAHVTITQQPHSTNVLAGSNANFTVVASGTTPLRYRWSFNGTNLTNGGRISGATNATLTVSNVVAGDADPYRVVVTNGFGSATSSIATLTVLLPPSIITQPSNQFVLLTSNANFVVSATGTAPLSCQWCFNSALLADDERVSGSTSTNLSIENVQTNDAGSYQLVITNNYGSATSLVATLAVLLPPTIIIQPMDLATTLGRVATLAVSADGTAPLTYRWQKDGADLAEGGRWSGTTNATLWNSSVQSSDAGNYRVVITNVAGSATSVVAQLSPVPVRVWGSDALENSVFMIIPPAATNAVALAAGFSHILVLRADRQVVGWPDNYYGQISIPPEATNAVAIAAGSGFSIVARGDGRVFAWGDNYFGQTNVPASATNVIDVSANDINALALRADGTVVGWGNGTYTPPPAEATNIVAISAGQSHALALRGDGVVLAWGDPYAGANTVPSDLSNVVAVAAGYYHNLALRADGTVAAWGENNYGQATVPAEATNVVAVAGGYERSVALRRDGTIVGWGSGMEAPPGSPSDVTNIMSLSAGDFGNVGLVHDPLAPIAPMMLRQPISQLVPVGGTVLFYTKASGSMPLQFQWFWNGAPLAGQTNEWLLMSNVNSNEDGAYQIKATNNSGSITSAVATLTAFVPVTIASQPTNQSVLLNGNTTFSAVATGDAPLSFQWYFNGTPLIDDGRVSGSSTTNLAITTVRINDAGSYQLVATNRFGTATSMAATLTVLVPAFISQSPTNQTVLSGSNVSFAVVAGGTAPLNYLWFSNDVALTNGGRFSGANSASLTFSGAQTGDSGAGYQVVVTNIYGAATSSVATLTVYARVQIIGQPSSQAVLLGSNATFTITAAGSALSCQWLFNGMPLSDGNRISGSATPMLTVSNVQSSDAGGYAAVVTNPLSSATSRTASLTPQSVLAPSVRYVASTCTNPLPPYLDWTTAATNIQDAIDASVAGDLVLVSNGVYSTGGRAVYGQATNRVTVDRAITVRSANGPASTFIKGDYTAPTHGGPNARCAYLTNGAVLAGFTLTNGGTVFTTNIVFEASGGGVWCEPSGGVVSNCVFVGNIAARFGGGAFRGTLINCLLTNNFASQGAGACSNTLFNCTLMKNSASYQDLNTGGGAIYSTLSNCLLVANSSGIGGGGGAAVSTLSSCVLSNNSANYGGGVCAGIVNNSLLSSNRALVYGGGAYSSALNNCVLKTNLAARSGGGAYNCGLTNCTVVGNNSAGFSGVDGGAVVNSIVYDNLGNNIANTKVVLYDCSIPYIGTGSITNAPLFVNEAGGDFHLQSNSPCINSGNNAYVSVTNDFDGNPRIVGGTVDIGAYEYQTPGSVISYAWLQQYSLPTDGTVDYLDLDGTGMNNWQKWVAGLNPTNPASVLVMLPLVATNNPTGVMVIWQSVNTRTYFLQRATNLAAQPAFSVLRSNIVGQAATTSYTDTTATNGGPYFYRIGVQW